MTNFINLSISICSLSNLTEKSVKHSSVPIKQDKQISPLLSSEKKKRVTFITSKSRKAHKSSNIISSAINPSLNKSDYYSKMRNSIFNKHKKSRDKSLKNTKTSSNILKEDRDFNYTSKILEKRRRALQKNLSAQKLGKSTHSRLKKNISFNKKPPSKVDDSSLLMGYSKKHIYPKIHGKKNRFLKESNSSYHNMISRGKLSKMNQSQSSNNLNFLSKKKFEESSKMYESIKKGYSKGFHKSKAFLMTSENFINFKKRKNIIQRSPAQRARKTSSKKHSKDKLKNRKINRSLQYKQKNSFANKVRIWSSS